MSKSWSLGGPSSCWGRTIGIIAPGLRGKVLNLCFWLLSSGRCGQTCAQSWHLWKCISQISVSTCYLATSVLQAQRVGFKMQNNLVFRYASMPSFGIKLYICSLVMSLPISLKVGKLTASCSPSTGRPWWVPRIGTRKMAHRALRPVIYSIYSVYSDI